MVPLAALCFLLMPYAALVAATAPQPADCGTGVKCPPRVGKVIPAAALAIPLNFDANSTRYLMSVAAGSDAQPADVVVDTGSGSFYDSGYNASSSTTAKSRRKTGYFGYGSGPIGPVDFYRDTLATSALGLGGAANRTVSAKNFDWLGAVAESRSASGLIGWSPPGWNENAIQPANLSLTVLAGSICKNLTEPCRNAPTAPQALLKAAKLPAIFSLDLNVDPNAAGGVGAGRILLGGVDAALASSGSMVPTPLAPNLHRKDFRTGPSRYVFWQFVPLKMSLIAANGTETFVLCSSDDVNHKDACTAIVDTGYGKNVVGDAAALAAVQAATDPAGAECAARLRVKLPTQTKGRGPVDFDVPLTTGYSGNCAQLTISKDDWVPPPDKLSPILPANWFVWGQPMIRNLYIALSFDAYGAGGLFFSNRA